MALIPSRQRLFDGVAVGASALCLIHCLALPMLFLLIPALAAFLALPESFHLIALAVAVPTSLIALTMGYRRHRWLCPAIIVLPGIALLAIGALAALTEQAETALTVIGALLLAFGHVLNWQAVRSRAYFEQAT